MGYQRVFWLIQRAWWVLLVVLLVLAALGLFGAGVLSSATATSGDLQVDYHRFLRRDTASSLVVTAPASAGQLEVALRRAYVERVDVESVTPEPAAVEVTSGEVIYRFAAAANGEVSVHFLLNARDAGRMRAAVRAGAERVTFTQYVYP